MRDTSVFLLGYDEPRPQNQLVGFCFTEADLVIGDKGYEKFRKIRGRTISPGEDGAYIVVETSNGSTTIGTDFSGYYKLFIFRSGEAWALSNSIVALIDYARARSLPITLANAHLAGFCIKGAFGNQLASLHTAVEEIRLIPATQEIEIREPSAGKTSLTLRRTTRMRQLESNRLTYKEALAEALSIWLARFRTILQSDLDIVSKLTGGQDSRTVLSLFLAATQGCPAVLGRIGFDCKASALQDLAIANNLANRYGLSLNSLPCRHLATSLNSNMAYDRWRSLCYGIYTPIYFPTKDRNPLCLTIGGAGGEGHRHFYHARTLKILLDSQRRYFPTDALFEEFRASVIADVKHLRQGYEADLDPLILHYRHFRDRAHSGRSPQYIYQAAPLGSSYFRLASSLCTPKKRKRAQLIVDLMMNCAPGIVDMPYDLEVKLPDKRHKSDVTDVRDALASGRSGAVFTSVPPDPLTATSGRTVWDRLYLDIKENVSAIKNCGLFSKAYIEQAITVAKKAAEAGQLSDATDGCSISHLLFAAHIIGN
jgi:hypothetical protein